MGWIGRISVLALLAGCAEEAPYSPARPSRLPSDAIYAGGIDGGDWVACDATQESALHCRIFDHETGELRRESWFRYCPQAGERFVGSVERLDAAGAHLGRVTLKPDRPDVFHPPSSMPLDEVERELDLIAESYRDDGVLADCSPVSPQ